MDNKEAFYKTNEEEADYNLTRYDREIPALLPMTTVYLPNNYSDQQHCGMVRSGPISDEGHHTVTSDLSKDSSNAFFENIVSDTSPPLINTLPPPSSFTNVDGNVRFPDFRSPHLSAAGFLESSLFNERSATFTGMYSSLEEAANYRVNAPEIARSVDVQRSSSSRTYEKRLPKRANSKISEHRGCAKEIFRSKNEISTNSETLGKKFASRNFRNSRDDDPLNIDDRYKVSPLTDVGFSVYSGISGSCPETYASNANRKILVNERVENRDVLPNVSVRSNYEYSEIFGNRANSTIAENGSGDTNDRSLRTIVSENNVTDIIINDSGGKNRDVGKYSTTDINDSTRLAPKVKMSNLDSSTEVDFHGVRSYGVRCTNEEPVREHTDGQPTDRAPDIFEKRLESETTQKIARIALSIEINETFRDLCKRLNRASRITTLKHCKRLLRDELKIDATMTKISPSSSHRAEISKTHQSGINSEEFRLIQRVKKFKYQIINPRMNPDTYRIGTYKFILMLSDVFSCKVIDGIDEKHVKRDLLIVEILADRVSRLPCRREYDNSLNSRYNVRLLDVYDFLKSLRYGTYEQKKILFAEFVQRLSNVELKWLFFLILRKSPFQSYRVNVLSLKRAKSYVMHEWLTSYFYKPLRHMLSIENKFVRDKRFLIALRSIGLRQFQIHFTNKIYKPKIDEDIESRSLANRTIVATTGIDCSVDAADDAEDDLFQESLRSQYLNSVYGNVLEEVQKMRNCFKTQNCSKLSLFSMQRSRVQNLPLYCDVVLRKLFEPLTKVVLHVDFMILNDFEKYKSNEVSTKSAVYLTDERRLNRFTLNFNDSGLVVLTKNFPVYKLSGANKNKRDFIDQKSKIFIIVQDCFILERKDLREFSLNKRLRAFYDYLSSRWILRKDNINDSIARTADDNIEEFSKNSIIINSDGENVEGDRKDERDEYYKMDDEDDDGVSGSENDDNLYVDEDDLDQVFDFSHSAEDLLNRAATLQLVLFDSPSCVVVLCDWYNAIDKYEQLCRLADIVNFDRFYFSLRSANDKMCSGNFWNVRPIAAERTNSFLSILGGWKNGNLRNRRIAKILVGCRRSRSVPLIDTDSWFAGEWIPCGVIATGLNKKIRDTIEHLFEPYSEKLKYIFNEGSLIKPDFIIPRPSVFVLIQCERIIDSVKYDSKLTFKLPKVLSISISDDKTIHNFVDCCDDIESLAAKKIPLGLR